jgi:predicted secreted protein
MASAKLAGVKGEFYVSTTKTLGVSNYDLNVELGVVDVSDHDSGGWGEDMTTTAKWSGSITAWYLGDATTGVADTTHATIMDACPIGTIIACEFRPNGTGTGKAKFSGNARVKGYKLAAPNSGAQPFNFDIVGVGALTRGTQT